MVLIVCTVQVCFNRIQGHPIYKKLSGSNSLARLEGGGLNDQVMLSRSYNTACKNDLAYQVVDGVSSCAVEESHMHGDGLGTAGRVTTLGAAQVCPVW